MVAGLAVTAAALAGVIALEQRSDPGEPAPSSAHAPLPAPVPADQAGTTADPVPGYVAAILARPLFEPSRRPIAAPAVAGTVTGLPRLTGVMVTPAGRSVLFAGTSGGKPVIAVEGSRIGAYVVQSIGAGTVTILGPDGMRTLRPSFDANRPASAPASPFSAPQTGNLTVQPRPPIAPPGPPAQNPDSLTLPLRTPS